MALFEPLFAALNEANVRYVVVGGLAVVLHGHARLTADVDLIIDLEAEETRRTMNVLTTLGLRPRVPVPAESFADAAQRERWISERAMRVFSLYDPENPLRAVDLFVDHPIDFEELWAESDTVDISGTAIRIASLEHLIRLKEIAGRAQDLEEEGFGMKDADQPRVADWEKMRRDQLESIAGATPAQRLAWLEDALRLAHAAGAIRRGTAGSAADSDR